MTSEMDSDLDARQLDIGFRLTGKLGSIQGYKDDDPEDDPEIYGTSPRVIMILLALVTLFIPVGATGLTYNYTNMQPLVYGVIWWSPIDKIFVRFMYYIVHPWELLSTIWLTIPLCAFNFLFIYQVNRWFFGKTSRDIVLFYGLLSIVVPSGISVALWATSVLPIIITPLPFQFVVGMILLYRFRDPDHISPWRGYTLDWSWWIRLRHSIHDPNPEVINLTNLLIQHDADWLENTWDE
ncbi:MAG: hypothetical protein ACFFEV_04800 [Candidatus Thorarchaeota archaeon]